MRLPIPLCTSLVIATIPSVLAAAPDQCSADCTHPTKACVCAIDAGKGTIAVTALGGIERDPARLRQALEVGDEIASADPNAVVSLTCSAGSDMQLHGLFRAVIMPTAPGQDCALNLLAGGVDVLTSNPTQVSSGETLMGSRRTQYAMRVARDDNGSTTECVVFEGSVDVRNARITDVLPLATGKKWTIKDGQVTQRGAVSPRDIQAATVVYARADVARALARGTTIDDPVALQRTLQAKYAAVLAKPEDPTPRIELATVQSTARMPKQALYQLNKAESLNPSQTQQRAAIAATKFDVYKQIGRDQDAATEGEKLRAIDPEMYKAKVGRLDSRKVERIEPPVAAPPTARPSEVVATPAGKVSRGVVFARTMVITAAATPSSVGGGQPSAISVTAKTSDGLPIAGAKVVVSAGGGMFRPASQTRTEGATDANGVFRTEWLCTACAPAYRLEVEVAATDFPAQKTTIDVTVR